MSTIASPTKKVVAVIKMPKKIGDKIIRIQAFVTKLGADTTFPTAGWPANIVTYVQFQTDVNALISAETAVKNKTGTTAARNAALLIVTTDLEGIMTMVQTKANANAANAQDIILNAGFLVKTHKTKGKQQNDAQNTQVLGTVLLTADTEGHHEWQMSKDLVSITNLPATSTSSTHVTGLNVGDVWYFRNHKVNTKKNTYNWSPWVKLIIGPGGKTVGGGGLPGHAGSFPTA